MLNSQLPQKWYVPFAAGDTNRVELPVTTTDPGRASQTLGFPPLTMVPRDVGGKPPDGEDMNGAMNQIARIVWWLMAGGALPFDAAYAGNSNINGYPNGARVMSADLLGSWLSTSDNNVTNPDTVGTNWIPAGAYGQSLITGLAGANVTVTPLQAAKPRLLLAGTLTANIQVILPSWLSDWWVLNNTTGNFTVTVKTASGSGVVIPQNSGYTQISGDGTNIVSQAMNVNAAVLSGSGTVGVVGGSPALRANITSGSTTFTLTDDLVIVANAAGAQLAARGFSQSVSLGATGIGGLDVGSAVTNSFIYIYAIYNPRTQVWGLLGSYASSTPTYTGSGMPAGFTYSARLTVVQTSAITGQWGAHRVIGRRVLRSNILTFTTNTPTNTPTSFSIAGAVPAIACSMSGLLIAGSTTASTVGIGVSADNSGADLGRQNVSGTNSTSLTGNFRIGIQTAGQLFYNAVNSAGSPTYSVYTSEYEI